MSLISGESAGEVPASIDRCWAVVEDLSRAPEWQQGLRMVTVIDRDQEGRPLVCETVIDAKFRDVSCRVLCSFEPPLRMSFRRIAGEVPELRGSWELQALGPERTRAVYTLAVDPGRVGLLARPLEKALRPIVVGARPAELAREVARRG
ncbi:MAG TPA: SRPBCC family protein [Solirubrobacteraceae bacterium]|nr:SRPBCC family protein [Solirubrobacteraceae bacterium]